MGRTLYQRDSAPQCRAARWVLERKGLAYTELEADDRITGALRLRFGTVELPLLDDGGRVVGGLRAIVSHLERNYGPPSVFPADPQKRNQAVTLAEFAEHALAEAVRRARDPGSGRAVAVAELRVLLGRVREAIGRRALDSGAGHLGDLTVAAALLECAAIAELAFDRDYADLGAYVTRVRATVERR